MEKIFTYNNYRFFLRDYYNEKKQKTGYFTFRYFAQIAGFSSPVFIKLVIDNKSNLRAQSIKKLVRAMELDTEEGKYFESLVYFNQAKSSLKKREYFDQLRALNLENSVHVLDSNQYDYYTKWYNSVLREITPNLEPDFDFKTLGTLVLPPLKARETKKAIDLLIKNGLLEKQPDGSLKQTNRLISTGTEFESLAVRNLHEQMAQLAAKAIEDVPKKERDISGLTAGISKKGFKLLVKEIKEFREKVMRIVTQDSPMERVYRLNLQLFPLSEMIDNECKNEDKNEKDD